MKGNRRRGGRRQTNDRKKDASEIKKLKFGKEERHESSE